MLPVRRSTDAEPNWDFDKDDRKAPEGTNSGWIAHWREADPAFCSTNDVILPLAAAGRRHA